MKRLLPLAACLVSLIFAGCLAVPESNSGGPGSVTVRNTNVDAINSAAQSVFAEYGYKPGPMNYPNSISFDKPAGAFGQLMYGSYNDPTSIRVTMLAAPLSGTNDFRLSTRVSRVSNAGVAGFEDATRMSRLWSGEFGPILRKIAAEAGGAGAN